MRGVANKCVADQCRDMGLKVGDTIVGREGSSDNWYEAELTLLWLGETEAMWLSRQRRGRFDTVGKWHGPQESSGWDLSDRDWEKVPA